MAFESNFVTFIGNLTDAPELRFTGSGDAVASFRVANNRKWTGKDGREQEDTTYMGVNVWRDLAENAAESLHKGDRVIVIGRMKVRRYENKEGQTVWVTEIEADEVAPSLRWARTQVARQGTASASKGQTQTQTAPPPDDGDVPF